MVDRSRTMNAQCFAHPCAHKPLAGNISVSMRACRMSTKNANYRFAAFVQEKQLNLGKESKFMAF